MVEGRASTTTVRTRVSMLWWGVIMVSVAGGKMWTLILCEYLINIACIHITFSMKFFQG